MNTSKTTAMPVGSAIARLVNLHFLKKHGAGDPKWRDREIESLVDALNAFEVNLSFDCETSAELQEAVEAAETALDVLLCDAETQCCRIADKATSEAARPRKLTSSRGD